MTGSMSDIWWRKKIWRKAIVCLFIFYGNVILSQGNFSTLDQGYFRSPVGHTFYLSGNFGELRETHFHTGLDIKPTYDGKPDPIFAIGDGYVSRLFVGPSGYGRAVYIDHPSVGYTSVYAHLDSVSPELEQIIRQHQMAEESFSVDFYLDPHILPISKGQQIGIMGNAGHSFGTHLHFEIRDTKTEKPINPCLFGIKAADHIPPSIQSIAIHGLDPEFHKTTESIIPILAPTNNLINITSPIEVGAWRVGIAVQTIDKLDAVNNKNGIYSLHMYVDDSLTYSFHMDKLSFSQTKNIIGFYDYSYRKEDKKTYTLCYKYPGNDLEFLDKNGSGLIPIYANKDRHVRLEIEDYERNKTVCNFIVRRSQHMVEPTIAPPFAHKILVAQQMKITEHTCSVYFDINSLFRNINFQLLSSIAEGKEPIYTIHTEKEPIKSPIQISIQPSITDHIDTSKAVIVHTTAKGGKINYGGIWENGQLVTKIREFGQFSIWYDNTAPTIKPISFTPKAGKKSSFTFKISDDLSTKGEYVADISYKVWIDGQFTISPFRELNHTLVVPIQDLSAGTHQLKIEVTDHSGNMAVFDKSFVK